MIKKILSVLLAVTLFATVAVGCAKTTPETTPDAPKAEENAAPVEAVVLRLAETHPADYPTTLGDYEFARLVEEKTEGRVKIEVFPAAQLGEEKDVIEQVQIGAIDITRTSIAPLTEFSPSLNVLQLPYIYRDGDHMWSVLNSTIGDDFLASVEAANFIGLGWFDPGARNFYNSQKEIKSLADLKGLKIRVMQSELMMDMVSALGASPTPLPYGEVYSSIQTGVIDGAENNWPSYDTSSHFEVAKYYTLDGHVRVPEIIVASKVAMEKVSTEDLVIIKEAAKEAQAFQIEQWTAKEEVSRAKVVAAGSIITELDDATKAEFAAAMKPVYDKYAADYADVIKQIQDMK
ncbi:MAG: C4-dicarboxylate ABC transporter [Firmicutes bacterium HGW-Firmicutes-1]|jgi:tripartite ATP-independent transporter DctP family solute receptor|nr:MAG: C4-dicarboxylate ABC transporter [Firmicutes bacterium HGW-Firmicutes-1]